jgi:hypothetical protein
MENRLKLVATLEGSEWPVSRALLLKCLVVFFAEKKAKKKKRIPT